ncbi:MAG: translation initiation factor IF-2 [Rickettsiales bacterium]|nr:translation initiation factor IF-2 [Rickettsiales bacterium]
MTDNENKNKRAKLTLKLPTSPSVSGAIKNKSFDKKISGSNVEVQIKGRKHSSLDKLPKKEENFIFDKKAFEKTIDSSGTNQNIKKEEIKSHEILSKTLKKEKAVQSEKIAKEEKSNVDNVVQKSPEIKKEYKPNLDSERSLDSFDVRDKIKKSIENTNREKQEREKLLEAKKTQEEKEKLEREQVAKERKKSKHKNTKKFEEEEKGGRPKNKDNKFNKRKQTYIVSDDDDRGRFGRKKSKTRIENLNQAPKEYKKISRDVDLPDLISVSELSDRMSEKAGDVVKKLFSMGMVVTSNQAIDADTAEIIIEEFGHKSNRVSHSDVENILEEEHENFEAKSRAPVVTIMGHVDHGKTSLLDAMRSTNIVDGEHGGITQHIGASRIKTKSGKHITFLDTPGHEAFSEMRSRGANVTDIVILVVAADDGVKEQTIEAIHHAKAAEVPIIVAINKIDKPGNDPSRVKNELLSHNIISEDMGGDSMFVEVSAKNRINLDKLEEAILLQAEVLELKSIFEGKSNGVVLESRVDPHKGVVATLLVQKGTLDISDLIVVGTSYGKVRKMSDDQGKNVKQATPSVPVEILGLDSVPNAGDKFVEVSEERQAREIISYRERKGKEEKSLKDSAKSLGDIFKQSGKDKLRYLNVIIKADVHGSAEAINGSIVKLNNEEVAIKVVHLATGAISESDISLASASEGIIIGFNVRANAQAKEMARLKGVDIRYYSIIYNLVDDLKLLLSGMLEPTKTEEYLGQAEIRQVFKVSGFGKIAGSFVIDGIIKRNAKIRLLRDNIVIHDGTLKTLKRFKEDAKEVKNGFECGIAIDNYEDIKEKDVIECYEVVETKREL